jgi:hypothetical protein
MTLNPKLAKNSPMADAEATITDLKAERSVKTNAKLGPFNCPLSFKLFE